MKPTFFRSLEDFRAWLEENHASSSETLVGFYKVGSRKAGISYPDARDEALCWGWIDAVRRSLDDERYTIRFTPRKPKSIWSAINIARIAALTEEGRMKPSGVAAFAKREEHRSKIYSFEKPPMELSKEYEARFAKNARAKAWFLAQAPSYRRTAVHWVMSAKQEETRDRRLATLIADSAAGRPIKPLSYGRPTKKAAATEKKR